MSCLELQLISHCLNRYFKNNRILNLKIQDTDGQTKLYQVEKWYLSICDFPLKLQFKSANTKNDKMTYFDFLIGKEYKFTRNTYDKEDMQQSKLICSFKIITSIKKSSKFLLFWKTQNCFTLITLTIYLDDELF